MTDIFKDGLMRIIHVDPKGWHTSEQVLTAKEVNTLFEAFKARMIAETTMERWPNLDCQGTTDGKGKIG